MTIGTGMEIHKYCTGSRLRAIPSKCRTLGVPKIWSKNLRNFFGNDLIDYLNIHRETRRRYVLPFRRVGQRKKTSQRVLPTQLKPTQRSLTMISQPVVRSTRWAKTDSGVYGMGLNFLPESLQKIKNVYRYNGLKSISIR